MKKVIKKIDLSLGQILFYAENRFSFQNNNFLEMEQSLSNTENLIFYTNRDVNCDDLIRLQFQGVKVHILNEKLEDVPKAKNLLKKLYYLQCVCKFLIYFFIINFIWNKF